MNNSELRHTAGPIIDGLKGMIVVDGNEDGRVVHIEVPSWLLGLLRQLMPSFNQA